MKGAVADQTHQSSLKGLSGLGSIPALPAQNLGM